MTLGGRRGGLAFAFEGLQSVARGLALAPSLRVLFREISVQIFGLLFAYLARVLFSAGSRIRPERRLPLCLI